MPYTGRRPGLVFAAGLGAVLAAALAPAGIGGHPIPGWSWLVWACVFAAALVAMRVADLPLAEGFRRVSWLLPFVIVLAVPAGVMAAPGHRVWVALALGARALAAATAATALAVVLGHAGLVRAARQLRLPARLVDVLEATLVSLAVVLRQVRAMLRAREGRRPGFGAWADLAAAPADTLRGFGRLTASLLLRSLERAEALEQARRARGVEP